MTDVAPSFVPIQAESISFDQPVGESAQFAIAGVCNAFLQVLLPVGSIINSMLTEAQFQTQLGNPSPATWILSDGRNVVGSAYAQVAGVTNAPDLRGLFQRGKDNGRGLDPNGNLPLGTFEPDQFASHGHGTAPVVAVNGGNLVINGTGGGGNWNVTNAGNLLLNSISAKAYKGAELSSSGSQRTSMK